MAVIQISRVQHRRGLYQDLPQLSAAELGWVVDQRRLFIGNGPVEEGAPVVGNTEILTQYSDILGNISSYTYKGEDVGYIAQTSDGSGDVQRTLQSKLDDFVNARDFGIVGDGTTDDSEAINWMLYQIYCREPANAKSKKVIYFPPGIYVVKNTINIPSESAIVGAGADHTIFRYEGSTPDYVARTADSRQQTGVSIGLAGAEFPQHIQISGCLFKNTTQHNAFLVDRAKYVHFDDVAFNGPYDDDVIPDTIGSRVAGVFASKQSSDDSYLITFHRCDFEGSNIGFDCDDEITGIVFDKCNFHYLYNAIIVGENKTSGSGPLGVKVTCSVFDNIYDSAIKTINDVTCFSSSFNNFRDVANEGLGAGNPVAPVIDFDNGANYSIGDTFDRANGDAELYARVENNNEAVYALLGGDAIAYGTHREGPGRIETLADDTSSETATSIDFDETDLIDAQIDFVVERGTAKRTGVLKITGSNTYGYTLDQEYTENFDAGVAFFIDETNGTITYTTTAISADASFKYRIRHFK
jgi:hypothetical protein